MSDVLAFFVGFFAATVLMLVVTNHLDDKRVERGWMEQRGKLYLLTPAKAVAP